MPTESPTILCTMTSAVTSFLSDLLARIMSGIKGMAPLVLGLAGCTSEPVDASVHATKAPAPVVEPRTVDDQPQKLGAFRVTFYYMIGEEEVAAKVAARARKLAKKAKAARARAEAANDNQAPLPTPDPAIAQAADRSDPVGELASIVVPEQVTIYERKTCKPILDVSKEFAAQLAMQGTGKLKDGRVLNVSGHCDCAWSPCFHVTKAKWGIAGTGRALQPFRTVAVDPKLIKLGSLLYIPALEGRLMPGRAPWGGFVHDGCVTADDVGGGIKGKQLDLFVGRRGYYHGLRGKRGDHRWAKKVEVFDGSKLCQREGRQVTRRAGAS